MKYAVLKIGMDYQTGNVNLTEKETYFATCWDCSTYICLKPDYIHVADSADMIRILTTNAAPTSLLRKINVNPLQWPSTPHDDPEACKYIHLNTTNNQAYFLKRTIPFIEHTAHLIRENAQERMYTLSDTFKAEGLHIDNMPGMDPKGEWNDVQFIEQLKNAETHNAENG